MRISRRILAVLVVTCLVLGVSAFAPAAARHGTNGTVCVVLDTAGLDDGEYNSGAVGGLAQAERRLHVETSVAVSETMADVVANIDAYVTSGECDLIIGVGFQVGGAMDPFAAANPTQKFAVIDSVLPYANVASILFAPDEAAFLAGYIAAGVSETGAIGTYGGLPIPPITDFMNGYALGAEYYNAAYGAAVIVLGWDVGSQSGLFSFTFSDPGVGYFLGEDLLDAGADAVMPVAGATGSGTFEAVVDRKATGAAVRYIGVDSDAFGMFGDPSRVILTSVLKNTGVAVYHTVEALTAGTWTGGVVIEDLETGGVDIAKFHKVARDVPGHLKNDLKAIRAGIIDGSIATLP